MKKKKHKVMDPSVAIRKFGKSERICSNKGKLYYTACRSFAVSGMEAWNLKKHFKTQKHIQGKLKLKASEVVNEKIQQTFPKSELCNAYVPEETLIERRRAVRAALIAGIPLNTLFGGKFRI